MLENDLKEMAEVRTRRINNLIPNLVAEDVRDRTYPLSMQLEDLKTLYGSANEHYKIAARLLIRQRASWYGHMHTRQFKHIANMI